MTVTHRMCLSPEYTSYLSAKKRCNNPKHSSYKNYGGRGIKFLFTNFEQFFAELGFRPKGMTLDRIDNDGSYESGNVRWATPKEQAAKRRPEQGMRKSNTSGIPGVYWNKRARKYFAQKRIDGKLGYFGRFDTKEQAAEALPK